MFSYLLYILPLGDRSSDLKKKLESYDGHSIVANILSDSNVGICFHIVSNNHISVERLVWKTLNEAALQKGTYWQVYCGRNISKEMREEIERLHKAGKQVTKRSNPAIA